jgi:tetratricopeptide (TPR) repeat protein
MQPLPDAHERSAGTGEAVGAVEARVARVLDALADDPPAAGGRYTLLDRVGVGGEAEVWRAWDEALGREVALKRPRPGRPADRLAAEADILARLRHPNVVPLYDLTADPGTGEPLFYTMPLVGGDTLRAAAARFHAARPPAGRARAALTPLVTTFLGVGRAVAHAHAHGVLHLDLKGDNVRLGPGGEPVVLDWGLARAPGTSPGRPPRTPGYAAPEQRTPGRPVDERTDVFGLGAVLYELLTGRPPVGPDPATRPPRAVWPGVPRPLDAVCGKALAVDPAGRYPSAGGLVEDVARWLADEPVRAYRESPRERAARWARHHGRAAAVAGGAAVLVIAALGFGLARADRERGRAVAALARERETLTEAIRAGSEAFAAANDALAGQDGTDDVRRRLADDYLGQVRGLMGRYPDDPGVRRELAAAWVRLGRAHYWAGRPSDALPAFEAAAGLLDELAAGPDGADDRVARLRVEAHALAGRGLAHLGRTAEARARLDGAGRLADDLLRAAPTDPARLALRGFVQVHQTGVADDIRAAERGHRATVDYYTRAGIDGRAADLPAGLLPTARLMLAVNLRDLGRLAEARAVLADATRGYQALYAERPGHPEFRRRVAACVNMDGVLLRELGDLSAAAERFDRAAGVRRELADRNPAQVAMRVELATTLANRADILTRLGRPAEALDPAREACRVIEGCVAADPGAVHPRWTAGVCRTRAGNAELALGRADAAAAEYHRALDWLGPLAAAANPPADRPRAAATACLGLGVALARQGRWPEARAAWRDAVGYLAQIKE